MPGTQSLFSFLGIFRDVAQKEENFKISGEIDDLCKSLQAFGAKEPFSLTKIIDKQKYQQGFSDKVCQDQFIQYLLEKTDLLIYVIQCAGGFHIYKPIASQLLDLYPEKTIYQNYGFWF